MGDMTPWMTYTASAGALKSSESETTPPIIVRLCYLPVTLTANVYMSLSAFKYYSVYVSKTNWDLRSSSVLGRLVLHEQIGWDRGRWVGTPKERKQHNHV